MAEESEARDLRTIVVNQAEKLGRHEAVLESMQASIQQLLDFAGTINAERNRRRRFSRRLRQLSSPALNLSVQHPPRPLQVPRAYLRTRPPDPAPRISIVTPSFNQGQFIERTIRSVIEQEYPNLEYVVQDGGSTDNTGEVLGRYADRLTRTVSEPDGGQADAINRGLGASTGEILAYLNSDDLLLPGSLSYVAGYFARHPDVDAVYGHRLIIDGIDREVGMWVVPAHRRWVTTVADFVPQETLFWRRRIWERVGGQLDASLSFAMDWDLLLRFIAAEARIARLPRFLGAFRTHEEQKTVAIAAKGEREVEVLRERWHGYVMEPHEVYLRLRPFYRRQKALYLILRARERLPTRRITVMTARPLAAQPVHDKPYLTRNRETVAPR